MLVLLPVIGVLFAALLAAICRTLLSITSAGRQRPVEWADAIVVFGAEATVRGPCAELRARLDHAADLYRRGLAPGILCCGGRSGAISEVLAMVNYLRASGVPCDALFCDEACPSTRSAVAAIARHAAGRWPRVLLVSSSYHLHRIMSEARWWGIGAIACPTALTPVMSRPSSRLRQVLREIVATWWYAATRIGRRRELPADESSQIPGAHAGHASVPVAPGAS